MDTLPTPPTPAVTTAPALKHSGLGIAAFVISLVAGIGMFLVFVIAGMMQLRMSGGLSEHKGAVMMVGVVVIGLFLTNLVGTGLAIGGLCQKERRKIFPILGLVFNSVIVFGVLVLMIVGRMSRH